MRLYPLGAHWNGLVSVPLELEVGGRSRVGAGSLTAERTPPLRRWLVVLAVVLLGSAGSGSAQDDPLRQAIRAGQDSRVRRAAAEPGAVMARDAQGETPLHAAAALGNAASVRLLLAAGADVNATNHAGVTPLLRAAADPEKVSLLLAHGAKPGLASQLGHTPLHLAARSSDALASVRLLVQHGANVNARSVFGATPLMAAAAAANLEAVKLLVEHGAEVNAVPMPQAPDVDPIFGGLRTPLMWAALRGDRAVAEYLLDHGADLHLETPFGNALSQAAWMGQTAMARFLLDRGARVNQAEPFSGFTALHWAASLETRRADLAELLLQRGASPNAEGGQPVDAFMGVPQLPLALAEQRGESDVTRVLRAAGARVREGAASEPSTPAARAGHANADAASIHDAMALALPPLQKTSVDSRRAFLQHASKQACVSCHQQFLPMAAIGAAQKVEVPLDASRRSELVETVLQVHRHAEIDWQPLFHPEATHTYGYALMGLDAVGAAVPEVSDLMVHHLAAIQRPDGHWDLNLVRPPMQSSAMTATALGVYTLQRHGWPARAGEFENRVRRAAAWLREQRPESHEERVYQLLGLHWAGASRTTLAGLSKALAATQAPDGGWAQHAGMGSDAYATGQALYALRLAGGYSERHVACRRAAGYLLGQQHPDGTWHVRRRAFPFQPTMDSGFPHGRDGWISATASSWAVMALGTMTEPEAGKRRSNGSKAHVTELALTSSEVGAGVGAGSARGESRGVAVAETGVDFVRDVQPLLERSCVPCHSGERPRGGYRLTTREGALAAGMSGHPAVLPGQASASPLVSLVHGRVPEMEMPPVAKRTQFPALSAEEVRLLERWVEGGAAWPAGVTLGK